MSEIKDNKDIEEVKESEARYNKPCKPDNLCCTCKDGPTVVKNESQCKEQCCKPKTVRCPDIREAKCIPALIDRIYDYVHLDNEQTRCAKDKTFEIIWAGTNDRANLIGKDICIKTITLKYDCLGIDAAEIPTEIGLNQTITLVSDPCSACRTSGCENIYTEYSGSTTCGEGTGCCENGRARKICQADITPNSCNLYIIVDGTAGCIPFRAQYLVDGLTDSVMGLGFKDVDFFGQVCLPDDRRKVNLRSMFDVCVSVPCVAPKSTIELNESAGEYEFTANIFASLLVTEKLYVVVKDEVAVYTTPNTLVATNGGFTLNCEA